jgi:hypothetical protein
MKSCQKWILLFALGASSVYGDSEIAGSHCYSQQDCRKPENCGPKSECSPKPKDPCDGPCMPDCALPCNFPRAYNESGRINVDSCHWDLFADASFIYWHVSQEYMDIGRTALFFAQDTAATPVRDAASLTPDFDYKPGFKVGAGISCDKDDWQLEGVYTRLHQQISYSTGTPITTVVAGNPVIVNNEWFVNLSTSAQQQFATMASKWTMNMDLFDLLLSRPFYLGRKLILKPYTGLSGMLLRQKYHIDGVFPRSITTTVAESNNWSRSWAIGPSIGANFLWLLCYGVRIEADAGMRLFYERFTKLKHRESFNQAVSATAPISGHMPVTGTLRPVTDLSLGLGWGSYFASNKYHVDLSASYEFALFAHQNMMRQVVGRLANNNIGYSNPIGDLFMHGLTATARFDF